MSKTLSTRKPNSSLRSPFRNLSPRSFVEDAFDHFLSSVGEGQMTELMDTAMDVAETASAFEIKLDLPGVSPDDVEIFVDNNTLTIRGKRAETKEEKDEKKQYHRIERFSGTFARSIVLPNSINEDEAVAEFKDGVLNIIVPKTEDAQPRKISIKK